ncbi:MchE protein OS=Rhodopirellula sp. SWK7 GN=RRSWK_02569 PE=4 SV=1 [Gemmataceae bacterium]|nr:MchE protein OS=Rhodopirellula sp. SWK7 GN=RRSWK_02569 PE=4 SV=1 [Gemmataceae bacterium]VTT98505.1 MchE protein OS=Rhodopirellula sp. SWK7 GN=RRSWK_02569 PE=4 SV=1 [Gemmataceae bacterium]
MRSRLLLRGTAFVLLLAALGAAAWTQRDRWQRAPDNPIVEKAGPPGPIDIQSVKLSEEAVLGLGLRCEEVKLEDYPRVIEVPGVIIDAPGRSPRAVSSPVAGVVSRIHASPGEAVKPGSPLFTVQLASEFVQTTQTDLARYAKDLVAATLRRDQTAKLVATGTKAGVELVEDENQVRRLTTQVEGHRRQLVAFGFEPRDVKRAEAGDAVTEITIVAPAADPTAAAASRGSAAPAFVFEVESLAVAAGQGVASGQLLARLADYRELLIEGRAFETEAQYVADATGGARPVGVDFLDAAPRGGTGGEVKLEIRSIGKTDPASRTFPFYAALANEAKPYERVGKTFLSWTYRPGRQVRLRVPVGTVPKVFVLPAGAVVREGADAYVFRQNGDVFDRKPVVIVGEDRLNVAVAPGNGIEVGVAVLMNQAAAVNRALKALQARGFGGAGGKKGHWHADGTFHEADD